MWKVAEILVYTKIHIVKLHIAAGKVLGKRFHHRWFHHKLFHHKCIHTWKFPHNNRFLHRLLTLLNVEIKVRTNYCNTLSSQ